MLKKSTKEEYSLSSGSAIRRQSIPTPPITPKTKPTQPRKTIRPFRMVWIVLPAGAASPHRRRALRTMKPKTAIIKYSPK